MKTSDDATAFVQRFGERVRALRHERQLSQEELAARADVHRTFIGMIERGEKNATLVTILKIARALEKPVDDLMTGLDDADAAEG